MIGTSSRRPGSAPAGFTLVEMLVTQTVLAILIGAVLAMVGLLARDRRRLEHPTNSEAADRQLLEQLRLDLTGARTLQADPAGRQVLLEGYISLSPATRLGEHRLVQVAYRIAPPESGGGLWRQQRYLDDPQQPRPWAEVLDLRATAFTLLAEAPPGGSKGKLAASAPANGRVPPQVRVVLVRSGEGTPTLSQLLILR